MQRLRTRLRASASRGAPAALSLDFLSASGALDPRITFSRGSNATLTDSTGRLTYAPSNLLTNSESFQATSGTVWTLESATATSNFATAPDGTATAERLLEATATSTHGIAQTLTVAAVTHCFSVYLKKGSGTTAPDWVQLTFGGTAAAYANFNLATGVVGVTSGTVATITDVGSGWFRCSITAVPTAGSMSVQIVFTNNTNSATRRPSYAGQTTSDVLIWGAQLEQVTYQTTPGTYNSTTPKNLLGFTQEFDNAAWTKTNAFVQTNLVPYSEALDNANWAKGTGVTVNANAETAPNGTMTADQVVFSSGGSAQFIRTFPAMTVGVQYTVSVFARIVSGTPTFVFDIGNGSATGSGALTPTATWQRFSHTFTFAGSAVWIDLEASAAGTIAFWGAQLVQGSVAGDYQRTDAAAAAVQYYAPDGTLTADKLVESAVAGNHQATFTVATLASPNAYSIYAKAGERSWVALAITDSGSTVRVTYFNLESGTVGTVATGVTASITSVGNGWYRCSAIISAALAGSNTARVYVTNADNATSYTGDGTSGLYIWGAQLSDSASLDPYVYNPAAAAASTAYYGPRFDYDPLTLAPKGLLIEEARTNLLTYSNAFSDASWGKNNSSVTSNSTASPEGVVNATTLVASATSGVNLGKLLPTLTNGQQYTASAYVKAGTKAFCTLGLFGLADAYFDLNNLTTSFSGTGAVSSSIINVGNGWRRISATWTWGAGTTYSLFSAMASSLSSQSGLTIGDTLYVYGYQLEAGSFATSYIPTVASTVTRSADVAQMLGDNFKSWYNQNAGTFVTQADTIGYTSNNMLVAVTDSGTTNLVQQYLTSSTNARFLVRTAGTDQATLDSPVSATATFKIASAYAANDFAFTSNGAAVQTDTSGSVPSVDRLGIGSRLASLTHNGHIQSIGYYNTRQPNATLQTLTNPSTTPSLALNFISDTYTVGA